MNHEVGFQVPDDNRFCMINSMKARGCSFAVLVLFFAFAFSQGAAFAADPSYPDSTAGLQKLIEDTLVAVKAGDKEKTVAFVKAMVLPDQESWFKKTFGDEKGKTLSASFNKISGTLETELPKIFEKQLNEGRSVVRATRVDSEDDENATGLQKSALKAMKEKTPLYSVRISTEPDKDGFRLWSFVYVDGHFRFVDKLRG